MKQKKKTTSQVIHEYGVMITDLYLFAMLLVLPLYKQNGYADIANAKFTLYRILTISFLVLAGGICFLSETISNKGECLKKRPVLPIILVFAHIILNAVSFVFSEDHKVSLWGSGSWHMGFATQMLILLAALLIYYYFEDKVSIWIAAVAGVVVTSALTVLNRFDVYPIDMGNKYPGFISTLGQTNWASLYVACLLGVTIGLYTFATKRATEIGLMVCSVVVFAGAWVIGSDTILMVLFGELFVLFGVSLKSRQMMKKFSFLMAAFGITTELVYVLVFKLFHDKFVFVDENDAVNTMLKKQIGIYLIVAAALLCLILYVTRNLQWNKDILKKCYLVVVGLFVVALVAVIICMTIVTNTPEKAGALANVRMLRFDDDWGTHRGLNWKCSVAGFSRLPIFRKIIGLGQGMFGACMLSNPDLKERIELMYGGYALKVAHNEYLNMLIEIGILGCFSYIGVLVTAFSTLWKRSAVKRVSLMALLSLTGYLLGSVFYFQHVYATSFMYIFIAMALSEIRAENAV